MNSNTSFFKLLEKKLWQDFKRQEKHLSEELKKDYSSFLLETFKNYVSGEQHDLLFTHASLAADKIGNSSYYWLKDCEVAYKELLKFYLAMIEVR